MHSIAVIDVKGGGIDSCIVNRLGGKFKGTVAVIAFGTNAAPSTPMMKSRAHKGAADENAVIWNSERADMIIGPLSIILPNALSGEVTVQMAAALVSSNRKVSMSRGLSENRSPFD